MTEKRYCGQCDHLIRKGIINGLPRLYCPVIKRDVSFVGYVCLDFKERVITEETDMELVEMEVRLFK